MGEFDSGMGQILAITALILALLVFFSPCSFSHSSENYSIPNIAIEPGEQGSSDSYTLYGVAEEPIGSNRGTSEGFELWTGFPATIGIPRMPGSFSVSADSNTQNSVSWDLNGNPTGTTFQLQEVSPTPQSLYSGPETSYSHSSLSSGQRYCYKIRAFNGVYSVYSQEQCASTKPSDPVIGCSSHSVGEWSNDENVVFTAASDANNFYYSWDTNSGTAVDSSNTFWDGSQVTKIASTDGNWFFHVRSANMDGELNDSGTVHVGPFALDVLPPETTNDANDEWRKNDIHVTLTAIDQSSSVAATYYCFDSLNECIPATSGTSADISCSGTCIKYLRYYSVDSAGNEESVNSQIIKIDKDAPSTPTVTDEGAASYDFVLNFGYSREDNNGSGISDFYLELRKNSTDGQLVYQGWTGESDGNYAYLGAEDTVLYYARGKVRDALGFESGFSDWTNGVYVNATGHPHSNNYALDMHVVVPSGSTESSNYSIADLVVGQSSVSMSSSTYESETGFAGGFIENSAPTLALNSPNHGNFGLGEILIDFNVIEAENDWPYLTIAYSLSKGGFQHKLLEDVNLNDYANVSGLDCDSNQWSNGVNCVYSWNVSSVQDNNYFIDLNAWDGLGASNSESSLNSIAIDRSAPSTSSDYSGEWSGVDINVSLSCEDLAGCSFTQYRLDSNPSKSIEFGSWQDYSGPFEVSGDGNYAIDFNSVDLLGNSEEPNREYVLINYAFSEMELEVPAGFEIEINEDMNKQLWYKCIDAAGNVEEAQYIWICLDTGPPTTTSDINSDWRGADLNVTLSPFDAASGVANTYYCVDDSNSCNPSTPGTSFSVECDSNSVCQRYVRYYSRDHAGNDENVHGEFVRIDNQAPSTAASFLSGWQGDVNIVFSCTDYNGAGCNKLKYRIDSGEWLESAFTAGDANVLISTDGNHLVEFTSIDNVDNNHGISSNWQAVDKTVPTVQITDPSTDYMEKGTPTISFTISRHSGSAIALSSVVVDFNGTESDDFNALADCSADASGDYSCSYTELDLAEDDYNLSVYAEDRAGNSFKASRVFTLKAIIGVRNVTPSGGIRRGTQQIRFEVKNTMLNDVYADLYLSPWFGLMDSALTGTMHLDDHFSVSGLSCEDAQWWDWTACIYSWNSNAAADGNYFIDVNFRNASGGTATGHSTQQFLLDNTAPVASVSDVSSSSNYTDRLYLGCSDDTSGCKATKWYYFSPTGSCSTVKNSYSSYTAADYLDISTDHNDYLCLWVEDKAGWHDTAVSGQLQVNQNAFVVSTIPSESQSIVTQDLNNECRMYIDSDLTVSCEFKSTIKISEWGKDLNRVYEASPDLVVSPERDVRVLLQEELEAFYHENYFLKFESEERTITSQGDERNYPVTVVRRRVIPLLTNGGELEVGTLSIKIRQR